MTPKPKRVQKASDRLVSSRKKLRKEDGVRASEALLKQLKQVTHRSQSPGPNPGWGHPGPQLCSDRDVHTAVFQPCHFAPPRSCPCCP